MSVHNTTAAEALLRKSKTRLTALQFIPTPIPPAFEGQFWQNAVDIIFEPLFDTQKEMDTELTRLKEKLLTATPDRKLAIERRMKAINTQLDKLDECYEATLQFVGSMCTSFYVEFKRLEEYAEDWERSHHFMAEIALQQTERLCKENVL